MESQGLKAFNDNFIKDREEFLRDLFEFLRFESISANPTSHGQVLACADWVADYLRGMGLKVELWDTEGGKPAVFAEWKAEQNSAGNDKPTLLLYGHYDVQPVDPLEKWQTPPFEPTMRNEKIFARGASDDKGQIFYAIFAIKSYLRNYGSLPINIKLIIEGEEEIGSSGLFKILDKRRAQLQADHLLIVDMSVPDLNTPSVTIGIRGLVAMTVNLTGSKTDLHSGVYGGIAYNPNHALVELFAKLRNPDGSIAIPGFYDDVVEVPMEEREALCRKIDPIEYEHKHGVYPSGGEVNYTPCESNWLRPTLEINGICGGYHGPGFKTVIPAQAVGKISCRLVPNQKPEVIGALVKNYLMQNLPKGITCSIEIKEGDGPAVRTDPNSPTVRGCLRAYNEVFESETKTTLDGATIPIAARLAEVSGAGMALIGVALNTDLIHAPNENFSLKQLQLGFVLLSRMLEIWTLP